jgi:D-hydroxyproline dehydrogenase
MKTALVIGNGLVGACVALALQRAGLHVTIVDAGDEEAAASFGNAGHLATEQCDPLASRANVMSLHRRLFFRGGPVGFPLRDASAWLPFGLKLLHATAPATFARGQRAMQSVLAHAIPAWERVTAQAQASSLIRTEGHFIAWETQRSAERGLAAWANANTGSARVSAATRDELAALQACFAGRPVAAAKVEGTGQVVDLRAMRKALQETFVRAGGVMRVAQVAQVDVNVTLADGESLKADLVVVAAGIGSANVLKNTYAAIPLIAERGYHIEHAQDARNATPEGLPVVFEDRNVIIAPFRSSLRMSGFTEFSRVASPPDERKWLALERHAREIGLFDASAQIKRWIGARPTLPDYLPAIGRHPNYAHLFYAFGHNHLGVTLAAITGELVAALVQDAQPAVDLSLFSLERFQ